MTDLDIIKRVRAGNTKAYEELVLRYEKKIYALAFSFVKNEQDALDITQEVFIKAYLHIGNFKNNAGYYTYLYRIAVNECKNFFARQKRHAALSLYREDGAPIEVADPAPSSEQLLQAAELKQAMHEEINRLDDIFRETLILRGVYGLSYEEIAERTGTDLGTVKSRIFRGREKVKKNLESRNLL